MIAREVHIEGFRSIQDCQIQLGDLQVLIGPNNCGKSNILRALEFFFDNKVQISPDDFCERRSPKAKAERVAVTVTYSDLTKEERDEFGKYVRADGSVKVCKSVNTGAKSEYRGFITRAKDPRYHPDSYKGTPTERLEAIKNEFGDISAVQPAGRLSDATIIATLEALTDAHKGNLVFEEIEETNSFMGWKNVAAGRLGRFLLLPAIPDPGGEAGAKRGGSLANLLDVAYTEIAKNEVEFKAASDAMDLAIRKFNPRLATGETNPERPAALTRLEETVEQGLGAWNVKMEMVVQPPDVKGILLHPEVQLDDGFMSRIELKGHGLQRAFVFSLLKAWKDALLASATAGGVPAGGPVIIAIEEPELYLHPQQQRSLLDILRQLASTPNHQVVLASHSAIFVDLNDPLSILSVKKEAALGTKVRQLNEDPFEGTAKAERKKRFSLAHWLNPARAELFFAETVVLVEGLTEQAVLPLAASKLGVLRRDVTVISCEGKTNIPIYMELLNAFGLGYTVVHDEDPVDVEPGHADYSSKNRTFQINTEIAALAAGKPVAVRMVQGEFETLIGASHSQGDALGKPLAAIEHVERAGLSSGLTTLTQQIYAVAPTAPAVAAADAPNDQHPVPKNNP